MSDPTEKRWRLPDGWQVFYGGDRDPLSTELPPLPYDECNLNGEEGEWRNEYVEPSPVPLRLIRE